jgi:hypothetical protein
MNYITVVRGRLKGTPEEAQRGHDATVEKLSAMTRPMGAIGHRPHLNPKDPTEFLVIRRSRLRLAASSKGCRILASGRNRSGRRFKVPDQTDSVRVSVKMMA